jgi:hypothetical protein
VIKLPSTSLRKRRKSDLVRKFVSPYSIAHRIPINLTSKKEYKEWADIRDRTSKRVWERVKHPRSYQSKLTDKESKEEKEYLEAFEEERRLKAEIEAMESQIKEFESEVSLLPFVHLETRRGWID